MKKADVPQRRRRRSLVFFRVPLFLEIVIATVLSYEVVRANVSSERRERGLFSLELFGVAPTVTLAAILATVLFTRSQYAVVTAPALAGHSGGWEKIDDVWTWTMALYNAGPGLARTVSMDFAVAVGSELTRVVDSRGMTEYLERKLGPSPSRYVREVSPGYPFKPLSDPEKAVGIFRVSREDAQALRILEVRASFVDALGDEYTWTRDFADIARRGAPSD